MTSNHLPPELIELNQQTGRLQWKELQPHFARGVVIRIKASLDLVQIAEAFQQDRVEVIQPLLQDGSIAKVTDQQARVWTDSNPIFWCIVIAPWVLIQPIH